MCVGGGGGGGLVRVLPLREVEMDREKSENAY